MLQTTRYISIALLFSLLAACTMLPSDAEKVTQQQLLERIAAQEDMLILDVRTTGEYSEGYIGNAINIDHRNVEDRLSEIAAYKNKAVVVYCYSGMRAGRVESMLAEKGFTKIQHLKGDWSAWKDAGLAVTMPE